MTDIPDTVRTALDPIDVAGRTCLEAGAGAGNMALALREAGAARVVAITDDPDHAADVRDRVPGDCVEVVYADLRAPPLPDGAVEVVTAHAVCNVLAPAAIDPVASEIGRVAAPGAQLVVVDYAPIEDEVVDAVFSLENAVSELVRKEPAYTFYPADVLVDVFTGRGWAFVDDLTVLDPVPWSKALLEEHVSLARDELERLPAPAREGLDASVDSVLERIPAEGVSTGRYYGLVFRRPSPGT